MKFFHLSCLDGLLPWLVSLGVGNFLSSCALRADVYMVISTIDNTQKKLDTSLVSEFQIMSLLMVFQCSGCQ